ncbi:hypothetical protein D1AOALGA4SA_12230, partial [Olavius algarvensis Delta 1 endosymbiont]
GDKPHSRQANIPISTLDMTKSPYIHDLNKIAYVASN